MNSIVLWTLSLFFSHFNQTGTMDDSSINHEISIVGEMITYYQWLFDVSVELKRFALLKGQRSKLQPCHLLAVKIFNP